MAPARREAKERRKKIRGQGLKIIHVIMGVYRAAGLFSLSHDNCFSCSLPQYLDDCLIV